MLRYLKENGFPAELHIETIPFEDPSEGWKGCKSKATDKNGNLIDEFYHKEWHDRVLWASGFFKGLGHKPEDKDWIENYSGAQL